ncbi:unnamed protein product [Cuscuta campestris]|uniref:Exocyst subunit Exo70 family protein n=1 Tax=Cuscuta campestris TaxID=132261 RepID=A0A484KFP4_9ASTE|nr:unnamed protein product [Cuscuta campestris]
MEKIIPSGKSISIGNNGCNGSGSPVSRLFITSSIKRNDLSTQRPGDEDSLDNVAEKADQICRDVDQFISVLSESDRSSSLPNIPDAVEDLCKIVESRTAEYVSRKNQIRFGKVTEEDGSFIDAVIRLSKLSNVFNDFPAGSTTSSWLNRIGIVLQRAMAFMEEELPVLLEGSRHFSDSNVRKSLSLDSRDEDRDTSPRESESIGKDNYPACSPEAVAAISRIASAMIAAGYENEFCQAYSISRRNAFSEQMKKFDFERINVEDVQKMPWDTLEGEITRWMGVMKFCSETLIPGERRLADSIFSDHPPLSHTVSTNFTRPVVIQLMDLAEVVSMTKRSAEKLFKFLDMYETICDLTSTLRDWCSDGSLSEIRHEIAAVGDRIGEAVVSLFLDLENSIRNDVSRTPVPGGAVHPLVRYVMNYLEYTFEYKDTLERIFNQHGGPDMIQPSLGSPFDGNNSSPAPEPDPEIKTTPFSTQIVTVMDLLDANLQTRASLYRDPSLRDIFLMNNGRYILQKVKRCGKMHKLMGDDWCRRRSGIVRQFHKSYQRETWGRVLRILNHDGLQVNGKIAKPVLKERFKSFTAAFEDIHKTQSSWVASDEQLQSELRVSISSVVIPAYRSFLGRFRQCLENSKQAERYIKYQPEDIEALIEELFEGNQASMVRRRA